MQTPMNRRRFLQQSSLAAAGLVSVASFPAVAAARSPSDKIRVGVIGCNGRGMRHIAGHQSVPNVEIAYVCDVDSRAIAKGIDAALQNQQAKPKGVKDLRRILEDPTVDAVSIATPDHWHAPAAILACAAGKHVYVE